MRKTEALKQLNRKVVGSTSNAQTIAELIKYLADHYTGGGSEAVYVDVEDIENMTAEEFDKLAEAYTNNTNAVIRTSNEAGEHEINVIGNIDYGEAGKGIVGYIYDGKTFENLDDNSMLVWFKTDDGITLMPYPLATKEDIVQPVVVKVDGIEDITKEDVTKLAIAKMDAKPTTLDIATDDELYSYTCKILNTGVDGRNGDTCDAARIVFLLIEEHSDYAPPQVYVHEYGFNISHEELEHKSERIYPIAIPNIDQLMANSSYIEKEVTIGSETFYVWARENGGGGGE